MRSTPPTDTGRAQFVRNAPAARAAVGRRDGDSRLSRSPTPHVTASLRYADAVLSEVQASMSSIVIACDRCRKYAYKVWGRWCADG